MIQSFRHTGLREVWEKGSSKKVNSQWVVRVKRRLTTINIAADLEEIDLPGYHLHQLKGMRAGFWAVNVTGNWRITFRPEFGGSEANETLDVFDVNLEDYH